MRGSFSFPSSRGAVRTSFRHREEQSDVAIYSPIKILCNVGNHATMVCFVRRSAFLAMTRELRTAGGAQTPINNFRFVNIETIIDMRLQTRHISNRTRHIL